MICSAKPDVFMQEPERDGPDTEQPIVREGIGYFKMRPDIVRPVGFTRLKVTVMLFSAIPEPEPFPPTEIVSIDIPSVLKVKFMVFEYEDRRVSFGE